jgi:hypothetical protein
MVDFEAHHAHEQAAGSTEAPGDSAGDNRAVIHVGLGSCCMAKGSDRLYVALQEAVADAGADAVVKRVGCVGMCHRTPLVEVRTAGAPEGPVLRRDCSRPRPPVGPDPLSIAHPLAADSGRRAGAWTAGS